MEDAERRHSVTEQVEKCRRRLLDTTKRNRLISFKHRERSNREIRIIDALPDVLYDAFLDDRKLKFCSLPDENLSPPDEGTSEFLRKFEQIELSENYLTTIEGIENEGKEDTFDQVKKAERDLKNKIREELNLPVWKEQKNLSNAEIAKKHGFNPSYETSKPPTELRLEEKEEKKKGRRLQTLLTPEEMSKKLNRLNKHIRSDIEELGINTLYVVFGFLEWYESRSSDKAVAPLLLLQLEIERKSSSKGGYEYSVQARGEEPEINPSLSSRLDRDFKIHLPRFTEREKPESYWNKISEWISKFDTTIPRKDEWRLRRFITVAHLNFSRLLMYQDIGEAAVSANKIVQKLFLGSNVSPNDDHDAEDYDVDTPAIEKAVPLLITSADASQHSALIDVMKGKNIAIKGPPGTGKSQTITNIIACAIAKGKRVLFLAEKMAALNVVHKRLRATKLDLYCLELHSTKARKKQILQSIEDRLSPNSSKENSKELSEKTEEFQKHRNKIKEYLDELHSQKIAKRSIRDYMGLEGRFKERLKDLPPLLPDIDFEQAILAEGKLNDYIDSLNHIVELKKEVGKEQHPWHFITNFNMDEIQEEKLKGCVEKWKCNLEEIQKEMNSFKEHSQLNIRPSDLNGLLERTKSLAHWSSEELDKRLIDRLEGKEIADSLFAFVEGIDIYRSKMIKSLQDILSSVDRIEEIEKHSGTASELRVEGLSAVGIQSHVEELKKELGLWDKYLPNLLSIGKDFGDSKNVNMSKLYALADLPDYIRSIPRDYLLFRAEEVIDERNTERLKNAVHTQEDVLNRLKAYEKKYDFSILGDPDAIRLYAATIEKAGFWAFFDPFYRRTKKLFSLASKGKEKFKAEKVAREFKDIAFTKEKRQKIEQDKWLQSISGSSFKGIDTDIERLQKINEWANCVRKRYNGIDEFSRSLCQWLLTAEMEYLDSVEKLAIDPDFKVLKEKLNIEAKASPDTPIQEYRESIENKKKQLEKLCFFLKEIARREDVTFKDVLKDLLQLQKVRKAKEITERNQSIKSLFGDRYAGMDTIIQDIEQKTARFIKDCLPFSEVSHEFEGLVGDESPKGWYSFIKKRLYIESLHQETKDCVSKFQQLVQASQSAVSSDVNDWINVSYADQISLLQRALDRFDSLRTWIEFNVRLEESKQDRATGELLSIYHKKNLDFETLPQAFEYMVYRSIRKENFPQSWRFLESLNPSCAHIKRLDEEIMDIQTKDLCNRLNQDRAVPGIGTGKRSEWTEWDLLQNEIYKLKRHIPIRELMNRAGESIQNIKPCFLMSPLSVATYLDPKKFTFDLVVIDEASQMRTEDALGGIVSSKQLVVVGDPKQMPPTSFFDRNDEEEEEKDDHESVMDMALSSFWPPRTLSRHYRSEHESLIAFSNYQFYEDKLWVYPSPVKEPSKQLGLRLKYVEGTYNSSTNLDEVEAIVEEAICFMRQYPDRSLGIATMNQDQQRLIEGEMERAFEKHQDAKNYETKWRETLEPFFVKNLENVQGDERDAIFISTVYGPDPSGKVMQRFGPINKSGGDRRLNVLFTRAKKNMLVFTSLKSEDITSRTEGAQALKGFLSYAKTGNITRGRETYLETESPFEEWVKESLESKGYEVHPQVGEGSFRIDLGIKHPEYPHGYLMGIECDGARYHSSKSARERDVIRQRHLENLGWQIHRIWSTDWWSNSKKEVAKVKTKIEKLLKDKLSQEKAKYPVAGKEVDQAK